MASALTLGVVGGGVFMFHGGGDKQAAPPKVNVPVVSPTSTQNPVSRDEQRSPWETKADSALEKLKTVTSTATTSGGSFSSKAPLTGGGSGEHERSSSAAATIAILLPTMSRATATPSPTAVKPSPAPSKASPKASEHENKGKVASTQNSSPTPPSSATPTPSPYSAPQLPALPQGLPDNPMAPVGTEDGIGHSVDSSGRWIITGTYQGKDIAQTVSLTMKYPNGQIPSNLLCTFREATLRCDAAAQLSLLDKAYQSKFGAPLTFAQGYRSLADQYYMKALWTSKGAPGNAVTPGTSNHGLGQAMDFSGPASIAGTAQNSWLVNNAENYGWIWPLAMRPGGHGPHESWHFDFMGPGIGGSTAWDLGKGGSTTAPAPEPSPTTPAPRPTTTKVPTTSSPRPSSTPTATTSAPPKPSPASPTVSPTTTSPSPTSSVGRSTASPSPTASSPVATPSPTSAG